MPTLQAGQVTLCLASGPLSGKDLAARLNVSQPTLSRVLTGMDKNLVRIRRGRTILYALRDTGRGFGDIPVHRVDTEGRIERIGTLTPVRDAGFVMQDTHADSLHSEGLPWWLLDMCPQGFMGRAYARTQALALGLPSSLKDWSDTHAVRALLAHGHDVTGHLLLGDLARERFLEAPPRAPIAAHERGSTYAQRSEAVIADDETWSSAGGEQPKFTAYAQTPHGPRHVIVKFTVSADNEVTQRWRDLLLCEHHALATLAAAGVPAASTTILDFGAQRFLEVERFDRVGLRGRRGLVSLSAVDSHFTGLAKQAWPVVTRALADEGHITPDAHRAATLLYAYGCLIGNTDMHHGNLAFLNTTGQPYELAPAFDMLPMAFQPHSGGLIVNTIHPVALHPEVPATTWRTALTLARSCVARLQSEARLSTAFSPCLDALTAHIEGMEKKIGLLV